MYYFLFSVIAIFASIAIVKVFGKYKIYKVAKEDPYFKVRNNAFNDSVLVKMGDPASVLEVIKPSDVVGYQLSAADTKINTNNTNHCDANSKVDWASALADGAIIPGLEVWSRWASVDESVFHAFSHLTHEQINGVADLLKVVELKNYSVDSEGFFRMLKGHVGEYHVLQHFEAAGASVTMPFHPNHPEFDLTVNGTDLNVKTVVDAGRALSAHLSNYDSSVVVPFDSANIPADALHFDPTSGMGGLENIADHKGIIVDHALSLHDVANQTSDALDVAADPGVHMHFPWVTAAVSTFRESMLIIEGNTDLARAAKNVALDTTAVGGGGFVGAKAGAAIGALFGPVGAVVGGLLGGAAGAMGGRKISNAIKSAPLNEAKENYQLAYQELVDKSADLNEWAGRTWSRAQKKEQRKMESFINGLNSQLSTAVSETKSNLYHAVNLNESDLVSFLNVSEKLILSEVEREINTVYSNLNIFQKILPELFAKESALKIEKLKIGKNLWIKSKESLIKQISSQNRPLSSVFDMVLAVPGGEQLTSKYIESVKILRQKSMLYLKKVQSELFAKAIEKRASCVESLKLRWTEISSTCEEKLAPKIKKVEVAAEELNSELAKAGLSKKAA